MLMKAKDSCSHFSFMFRESRYRGSRKVKLLVSLARRRRSHQNYMPSYYVQNRHWSSTREPTGQKWSESFWSCFSSSRLCLRQFWDFPSPLPVLFEDFTLGCLESVWPIDTTWGTSGVQTTMVHSDNVFAGVGYPVWRLLHVWTHRCLHGGGVRVDWRHHRSAKQLASYSLPLCGSCVLLVAGRKRWAPPLMGKILLYTVTPKIFTMF